MATSWQNYTGQEIKAGMVIKWKTGTIELVGDINKAFGVCDDCTTNEYNHSKIDHIEIEDGEEWDDYMGRQLMVLIDQVAYLEIPK